jgi:MFS family permease
MHGQAGNLPPRPVHRSFTDPAQYDLSSTRYGTMFLPQVTAIIASLLGGTLARHLGSKRVYLVGLSADLVSRVLLIVSQFVAGDPVAYGLLLAATAFLGIGFGLTAPTLNTLTAVFHPAAVDRSVLALNALLGLGTALARCSWRSSSASASGGGSPCSRRSC